MGHSRTLFARTGITLSIALLVFLLFTVAVILNYILVPLGKRAADDFTALMVLSAQTWVELPPGTRPDFERELQERYRLKLTLAESQLPPSKSLLPYLQFLENSLEEYTGEKIPVSVASNKPLVFAVDISMAGRALRFSFPRERIGAQPPAAVLLVIIAGMLVILLTTLLLVRRLTDPLTRLSEATARVGHGDTLAPLPETGPREIAVLTHNFNRMAREVTELLANRTTLFAGISHDLRTPITRMQLALELLPGDSDPTVVNSLRQGLEDMNRLIQDTLELARGLQPHAAEEVDLRDFLDGIIADYRRSSATEIYWSPGTCCICTVETLALHRVLTNLIDNAVRYGGDHPVEVRCDCPAGAAVFRILDRGTGIPAAEREAVFRPFYRLETSRSRATGGSGLGLAIARQLCETHGWEISLQAREGGGTQAQVRVPLDATRGAAR